jgi:NADH dehydrogenase
MIRVGSTGTREGLFRGRVGAERCDRTMVNTPPAEPTSPRIVILGAGFAGIQAARALRHARARVTVIDRLNHHVFQPLLYHVATADLSPADIATPIRVILRRQHNTDILLAEVVGADTARRVVRVYEWPNGIEREIPYDFLVVATGARHSYFGHEVWASHAPGLKSLTDATAIRRKILLAFDAADTETDLDRRAALLTFVIVGGGPTGVEMAGAIADFAHKSLRGQYRHIDPTSARILLVEAGPHLLPTFPVPLAEKARRALIRRGVEVHTGVAIEDVSAASVVMGGDQVPTRTIIWAAGVMASPAGDWLGASTDRSGRVIVSGDLSLPNHPEVFVLGDTAHLESNGRMLPGVAPVAMQQGRYVARVLRARIAGHSSSKPFYYRDKGSLAAVGRDYAIADLGKVHMTGRLGWLAWVAVHIAYLIGFRNRVLVLTQWAWLYFTNQRSAQLITVASRDGRMTPAVTAEHNGHAAAAPAPAHGQPTA